jgi:hypothetical protein
MAATCRLAAIFAPDVAGYSRLMGAGEEGTLERLKTLPKVAQAEAGGLAEEIAFSPNGRFLYVGNFVDGYRCLAPRRRRADQDCQRTSSLGARKHPMRVPAIPIRCSADLGAPVYRLMRTKSPLAVTPSRFGLCMHSLPKQVAAGWTSAGRLDSSEEYGHEQRFSARG